MNTMTPGDPGMRTVNGTTSKLGLLRGGGINKRSINIHTLDFQSFFFKECLHINQLLGICHIMLLPYIQEALEAKSPAGEKNWHPVGQPKAQ